MNEAAGLGMLQSFSLEIGLVMLIISTERSCTFQYGCMLCKCWWPVLADYVLASVLVVLQDGRLHSGDHLLQIGDINVRGMGSEQVASVLRQSGTHVHLIVARGIIEPPVDFPPYAPIIPTIELTEHLRQLNEALLLHAQDLPGQTAPPEAGLISTDNPQTYQTVLPAEIHPVNNTHVLQSWSVCVIASNVYCTVYENVM